jgi:hypothetical protein
VSEKELAKECVKRARGERERVRTFS